VDHDLSWHNVDEEFNEFAIKQTGDSDTLVFGRKTYELMESYWPTEGALKDDPEVAHIMNTKPKVVFSKTLDAVTETEHWKNVTLVKENMKDTITRLKEQEGKDIAVLGSNNLCVSLLEEGLLDELRIMVAPVVLGKGTRLFEGLSHKIALELTKSREFKNGNVLLYYHVKYDK
jgi:dihydrofolate reductase